MNAVSATGMAASAPATILLRKWVWIRPMAGEPVSLPPGKNATKREEAASGDQHCPRRARRGEGSHQLARGDDVHGGHAGRERRERLLELRDHAAAHGAI